LARLGGWPLPHHLPTAAMTIAALRRPISAKAWADTLLCCLWACWTTLAATTTAEALASARGWRTPRLLRVVPLHRWVSETIAAVAILAGAHPGAAAAAPLHALVPAATATRPPPRPHAGARQRGPAVPTARRVGRAGTAVASHHLGASEQDLVRVSAGTVPM